MLKTVIENSEYEGCLKSFANEYIDNAL